MFPVQIFEHNNDEREETRKQSQSSDKIEELILALRRLATVFEQPYAFESTPNMCWGE